MHRQTYSKEHLYIITVFGILHRITPVIGNVTLSETIALPFNRRSRLYI